MNYHRLPAAGPRTSLPAFIEPARGLEPFYRADGGPELEAGASQVRAMLLKALHLALKYKLVFACSCCISLLIGLAVTFITPKVYRLLQR